MSNVIRSDVVQISWDIDKKGLSNLNSELDNIKKSIVGDLDSGITKMTKSMTEFGKSTKYISKLKDDIEIGGAAIAVAKDKFDSFKNAIKNVTSHPIKSLNDKILAVQMSAGRTIQEMKNLSKVKIDALKSNISEVKNVLTEGKSGANGFKNALKNVGKVSVSKIISGVSKTKTALTNGVTKANSFLSSLKKINLTSLNNLTSQVDNLSRKIGTGLVNAAKKAAIAVGAIVTAVAGVATKGIQYNAQMETYQTSFEVMTGSAQKAVEITNQLQKMGAATPFEMTDLADTTQLLMQYGFTANDALNRMSMLGDISQGSADKMNRIAMAYGQMSSAGKVSLEDVKQMIEAGFNPLQEISSTTGESMASLYDRISDGKLSIDEITASMQRSTSEGGKYFQSMEKQSKTFSGQLSTLQDNFNQFVGTLTKGISNNLASNVLPKINETMSNLTGAFEKGGFSGLLKEFGSFGSAIQKVIDKIKEVTTNSQKMEKIKSIFSSMKSTIDSVTIIVGNLVTKVIDFCTQESVLNGIKSVFDGLNSAIKFCSDHSDTLGAVVLGLVAAFTAFKVITTGITIATAAYNAIQATCTTIKTIATAAQMGFNAALLACPITWIVAAIAALIAIIVVCIVYWDEIKAAAVTCWEKIKAIWGVVANWFSSNIIEPIKTFFSGLWNSVSDGVSSVKETIAGAFTAAYEKVVGVWEGITGFFKGIWDGIKGTVNKLINKGKEALGVETDVKNQGKKHAWGGLMTSPHWGLVAEDGAEMIIPLSKDKRSRGLSLWQQAGNILGVNEGLARYTPEATASTTVRETYEGGDTYSPTFNLTINNQGDDREMEYKVKKWLKEGMDDIARGLSRRNPRMREV